MFDEEQTIIALLATDAICGPAITSPIPRPSAREDPSAYRLAAEGIESICCELLSRQAAAQVSSVEAQARAENLPQSLPAASIANAASGSSCSATIIDSHQPAHLTNRFLQNLDGLPLGWADQDALLLA